MKSLDNPIHPSNVLSEVAVLCEVTVSATVYSVAYKAAKNIPNPFFFTPIFMDGNRYGEFVDSVGELPALYVAVSLNF